MSQAQRRVRYDAVAAATAQFYNTTGTVPSSLKIGSDVSYMISTQPNNTIVVFDTPTTCSDRDLVGLFTRFGPVLRAQKIREGQAALVEFSEISSPTRLVHMAKINPFYVGPNRVRLEFSTQAVSAAPVEKKPDPPSATATDNTGPTHILHLDVAKADYPINVDVLKAIASPHGRIQRVFIGKKNVDKSLEVLLEYETVAQAQAAKENLDGADIYSGCCSLTVTFSRLKRVHVTENSAESWDYTGPNADREGPIPNSQKQKTLLASTTTETNSTPVVETAPTTAMYGTQIAVPAFPAYPSMTMAAYSPYSHYPQMPPPSMPGYYPNQMPPPPISGYGIPRIPPANVYAMPPGMHYPQAAYPPPMMHPHLPPGAPGQSPVQGGHPPGQKNTRQPSQHTILPTPIPVHHVTSGGIGIGHAASNLTSTTINSRQTDLSIFETGGGVTLMASNMASTVNCDLLFNLLCVYGNVARIKFIPESPGCALIQMGNTDAVDLILKYLDGANLFGSVIKFSPTQLTELEEIDGLGNLPDGSPMMKNYMIDPNNRFRNALVAAKCRILEPSRTLHFFNVPLNFTPEDMCRVMVDAGAPSPPRMVIFVAKTGQKTSLGLVEWDTVSESLTALTLANHRAIHVTGASHPFHLKLAFSPKPISEDRAGVAHMAYPAPPLSASARSISAGLPGTAPPGGLTVSVAAAASRPCLPQMLPPAVAAVLQSSAQQVAVAPATTMGMPAAPNGVFQPTVEVTSPTARQSLLGLSPGHQTGGHHGHSGVTLTAGHSLRVSSTEPPPPGVSPSASGLYVVKTPLQPPPPLRTLGSVGAKVSHENTGAGGVGEASGAGGMDGENLALGMVAVAYPESLESTGHRPPLTPERPEGEEDDDDEEDDDNGEMDRHGNGRQPTTNFGSGMYADGLGDHHRAAENRCDLYLHHQVGKQRLCNQANTRGGVDLCPAPTNNVSDHTLTNARRGGGCDGGELYEPTGEWTDDESTGDQGVSVGGGGADGAIGKRPRSPLDEDEADDEQAEGHGNERGAGEKDEADSYYARSTRKMARYGYLSVDD